MTKKENKADIIQDVLDIEEKEGFGRRSARNIRWLLTRPVASLLLWRITAFVAYQPTQKPPGGNQRC